MSTPTMMLLLLTSPLRTGDLCLIAEEVASREFLTDLTLFDLRFRCSAEDRLGIVKFFNWSFPNSCILLLGSIILPIVDSISLSPSIESDCCREKAIGVISSYSMNGFLILLGCSSSCWGKTFGWTVVFIADLRGCAWESAVFRLKLLQIKSGWYQFTCWLKMQTAVELLRIEKGYSAVVIWSWILSLSILQVSGTCHAVSWHPKSVAKYLG